MYWSPRKPWLSYFIFYIDDILHKYTFWIWKSLHLDIFEEKKNDKLIYRENIYKAIAFLNSFTLMTSKLKTCGATRNPEFPRTGPDRTETGPGSGNSFKNFFGSDRVGEFYFGSVRVRVFFTGVWDIFSRDFGDKLAFHSQTEKVEWLLSLISTLFDVITSLQGIFTCLL